jgi:hypothetical protein
MSFMIENRELIIVVKEYDSLRSVMIRHNLQSFSCNPEIAKFKDLGPNIKDHLCWWLYLRYHNQQDFRIRARSISSRWHKRDGILRLEEVLQDQGIGVFLLLKIEVFYAERESRSRIICTIEVDCRMGFDLTNVPA